MSAQIEKLNPTVYVVFISLLLDLLAFTVILPLMPSILDHYKKSDELGLYTWLAERVSRFQEYVGAPEHYNSVLFGGVLGSLFSFLQFLASPIVGSLSDVLGRKKVMLGCMIGISFSYILWALSSNFGLFILSRFIGGLSKGNVSLCMAIITDVSSIQTRGKGMALIGIAFSVGFIVGPIMGSVLASTEAYKKGNTFILPALLSASLSIADALYFYTYFQETLPKEKRAKDLSKSLENAKALIDIRSLFSFKPVANMSDGDAKKLKTLGLLYFVFMFIYSGLEFTLTFLTHHVFKYTFVDQGIMFFVIGIVMASFQGGYVRRIKPEKNKITAIIGLWMIIPAFFFIGICNNQVTFYFGLILYSISTALVIPCLTVMASNCGSDQQKGTVMGIFRSLGALARASGPIVASMAFWMVGSKITYLTGAVVLLWPVLKLKRSPYF